MSTQRQTGYPRANVEEHSVVEFLRKHPDFFQAHTDLLADLTIPHNTGGAVSLVERQVSALRDLNRDLKRQLQALIHVARENDRLNDKVHRLTLSLMEARTLDKALSVIHDSMQTDFRADIVTLRLFAGSRLLWTRTESDVMDVAWISREGECASAFTPALGAGKPL